MKMNKKLAEYLTNIKKDDSYWVEKTKMDFAYVLEKRRKSLNLTYSALAEKLGTSAAYITKIFRGDANLTIESMAKLARATGGHIDIKIVESQARNNLVYWQAKFNQRPAANNPRVTPTNLIPISVSSANEDTYSDKRAMYG